MNEPTNVTNSTPIVPTQSSVVPATTSVPPVSSIPPVAPVSATAVTKPVLQNKNLMYVIIGIIAALLMTVFLIIAYSFGMRNTGNNGPRPTVEPTPVVSTTETPSVSPTMNATDLPTGTTTPTATPTPNNDPQKEDKRISVTWTEPYQSQVLKWNYVVTAPKGYSTDVKIADFEAVATITSSSGIKLIHRFPAEIAGSETAKKNDIVTIGQLNNGRTLYRAISKSFHKDRYRYFDTVSTTPGCGESAPSADEYCLSWGVTYGAVNANERVTDPYIDAVASSLSAEQLKVFDDLMLSIRK